MALLAHVRAKASFVLRCVYEIVLYVVFGVLVYDSQLHIKGPARKSMMGRVKHVQWLLWYRYFDHLTQHVDLAFMNWGYESAALAPYDAAVVAPVLAQNDDDMQRIIETCSFNLYQFLCTGPSVGLAGKRVLEVSCGKGGGLMAVALLHQPATAVGIDMCAENVARCVRQYVKKDSPSGDNDEPSCTATHAHTTTPAPLPSPSPLPLSLTRFPGLSTRVHFMQGDALAPFPAHMDYIINVEASHCYSDRPLFFLNCHTALAPGGRLLFADFISSSLIDPLRRCLVNDCGFVLERDEDLTTCVLHALDKTDGPKRALISSHAPFWAAPLLQKFASTRDSHTYRMLANGTWRYWHFQARRK